MIAPSWGTPQTVHTPDHGHPLTVSSIADVAYWLDRNCPIADAAQGLAQMQAAMDCLTPVSAARVAFAEPAIRAGATPRPT